MNKVLLEQRHIFIYNIYFHITKAKLSSCSRNHTARKAQNRYDLASYKKKKTRQPCLLFSLPSRAALSNKVASFAYLNLKFN